MTIRLLVVDDQALVRAGFRMILDAEPDLEIVAEAADGLEALAAVDRYTIDVALMDIRMPNLDGIEATRRLVERSPGTHVLMLTTFDFNEYVYEALRAGAAGFLLKDAPPEQLIAAIHTLAAGEALIAPAITKRLLARFVRSAPPTGASAAALEALTPREREVLVLISRGHSNGEIATELVLSEATVKTHVKRVLAKLGVRDRVHAVVLAYESALVTPGA